MANTVLDSMIMRADFAQETEAQNIELFQNLKILELDNSTPISKMLRKPDFQRETNHWKAEQISTFISTFARGELIPSIILWKSDAHIFVIDGAHRLSALLAWINNDYGDGSISHKFFGGEIPSLQKKSALATRKLVEATTGRYADFRDAEADSNGQDPLFSKLSSKIFSRAIPVQWIQGSQEVAESSFFKINSQGTPLDKVEELLLKNRNKANAIAARSIVRAGTGHKYWSEFDQSEQKQIEEISKEVFELLFQPDISEPIKTLDLPLGGTTSPVDALKLLLDFFCFVDGSLPPEKSLPKAKDDTKGAETIRVLKKTQKVVRRITGTSASSLGLHPALYFYNEKGKHSRFLFLGVVKVFADAVRSNNKKFFFDFTDCREKLENSLSKRKALINQALANVNSSQRIDRVANLIEESIKSLKAGNKITDAEILTSLGLSGKISEIKSIHHPKDFSKETKSAMFLKDSLNKAMKCPICKGLLDPTKAASYDHIMPKKIGGAGNLSNGQITHPFCNTTIKN